MLEKGRNVPAEIVGIAEAKIAGFRILKSEIDSDLSEIL